jgi:hypothetical protein
MELTILRPHTVRFRGPDLGRGGRGALSAAGVSVIERHARPEWRGQLQEFLVSVEARDSGDAVRRVREALEDHGAYESFSPEPR